MIGAIRSIYTILKGLFTGGGLVSRAFTWLGSGFGAIVGGLGSIGSLLFGGFAVFGQLWGYIASYHVIELIRRFLLITFVYSVFGWIINYALTSVAVSGTKTISILFNEFITSIASYGVLGNNLLAILTKMGVFECFGIFLTVMIYTLIARVSLSILFK